jgi:hypothetical protein
MAADFSAIEARVLNWLAGQDDVVENFRAYSPGDKTATRTRSWRCAWGAARRSTPSKPSEDYSAGKAAELGCGFGMGADKFVSAAWTTYQVRVTEQQAKDAVKIYRELAPEGEALLEGHRERREGGDRESRRVAGVRRAEKSARPSLQERICTLCCHPAGRSPIRLRASSWRRHRGAARICRRSNTPR